MADSKLTNIQRHGGSENEYPDCPRHSLGEPKRMDQRDRYFRRQCVYCGSPKPPDLLGPACQKTQCQGKRWDEFKPTEKQMLVFRRIHDDKHDNEIASEMGISTSRVKEHIRAIARKLDVRHSRVLLARCFCEWQEYLKHQIANPSPQLGTPLKRTPRKRTPPK